MGCASSNDKPPTAGGHATLKGTAAPPPKAPSTQQSYRVSSTPPPPKEVKRESPSSVSNSVEPPRRGGSLSARGSARASPSSARSAGISPRKRPPAPVVSVKKVQEMCSERAERYTLGEQLGKGSYGTVYKALDTTTKKDVAVKVFNHSALQKLGEKQLCREVCLMGALRHPNIIALYQLVLERDTDALWIVVEYVEGCHLGSIMEKNPNGLDERTAKKYFQQMIVALHYCHLCSVAHRDLKPENILVSNKGEIKVTDFGLSNVQLTDTLGNVTPEMALRTRCGTPYFLAPEVPCTRGYNGFAADMWSIGVVLYNMLSGSYPFMEKAFVNLIEAARTGEYRKLQYVSRAAEDLISGLLQPRPDQRLTALDAARHEWVDLPVSELQEDPLEIEPDAIRLLQSTISDWNNTLGSPLHGDTTDDGSPNGSY